MKQTHLIDASAINCTTFFVDSGKSFTADFRHFKHAIKADETIDIASGSFELTGIQVGFKTDKFEDGGIEGNHIYITGGTISTPSVAMTNNYSDDINIAEGVISYK